MSHKLRLLAAALAASAAAAPVEVTPKGWAALREHLGVQLEM